LLQSSNLRVPLATSWTFRLHDAQHNRRSAWQLRQVQKR
jgi:hypothetical protein